MENQCNEGKNQQKVNHCGSHMENKKSAKPEHEQNHEQDNKYW
jgi:hypothetical protein